MTAIPDLQHAVDLLSDVIRLLYSLPETPQIPPSPPTVDPVICTDPDSKSGECNEMGTSPISLTTL